MSKLKANRLHKVINKHIATLKVKTKDAILKNPVDFLLNLGNKFIIMMTFIRNEEVKALYWIKSIEKQP